MTGGSAASSRADVTHETRSVEHSPRAEDPVCVSAQPELELSSDQAPDPAPATARAVTELLRGHYLRDERRPAGIFAPDIQAPGPSLRKADVIWLGCTAAAGHELVGHEIKVSRADLLRELADLTKSDPWQRYCDRWWLVVPTASLITGLELPESWGVMLPPSGRRTRGMTVHRAAPRLAPAEQAPALRVLAAWQHWRIQRLLTSQRELQDRLERAQRARDERELALHFRDDPAHRIVARIVEGLGGAWGQDDIGDWLNRVRVEDVVTALRELGATYHQRDEIARHLGDGRRSLLAARTAISGALDEIERASS